MHRIFKSIMDANAAIENCLQQFERNFVIERNSIFAMIKSQSPHILKHATDTRGKAHENPIRREIRAYYDMLQQEIHNEHQEIFKGADDHVQRHINFWMKLILDNALVPTFDIGNCVTQSITPCVAKKQWLSDIHARVLCNFFDRKVEEIESNDRPKFDCSRAVFDSFRKDIELRAQTSPFKLSSLIQDFMIHLASARRGLGFYRESAHNLLEAVKKNDVVVVATPTGRYGKCK